MASGLIDSTIVVDIMRGYGPAAKWLENLAEPAITRIVHLEVLAGSLNKIEQQKALRFLQRYSIIELTLDDFVWATRQLIEYKLSHNVGIMDCLIAAPAARLQLPLYTHNLKHFTPLLGELAQKPY